MYDASRKGGAKGTGWWQPEEGGVVISDGNDTNSHTDVRDVRQVVRETEVLRVCHCGRQPRRSHLSPRREIGPE